MDITVLGCSGTYAAPGNACSGYLVQAGGFSLVADLGPGSLSRLSGLIGLDRVGAVVISHSHPDHWLEMPILRNALRYVLGIVGLDVYATAETWTLFEMICPELDQTFIPHVITDGDDVTIGPINVRFARTDHPPETLSMRFDHGDQSIAYSADTGPGWSFAELGTGIDLGVCEATYLDAERARSVHLTAAQAGSGTRAAGVRSLVLTHLIPGADESEYRRQASETYGAPVHIASPGATFTP